MLTQQLLNGLLLGATYCLIALGFNLVVGALDKLNFALGESAMVATVIASIIMTQTPLPFIVTFLVAITVGAVLAVLVYYTSFKFVKSEYRTASILSSLGMGVVLTTLTGKIFGTDQRIIPELLTGTRWDLGFVKISASQVLILVVALVMTVALYVFLERTNWGIAIRGVSDDATMSGLLGVPVERVVLLTFALSGVFAGAAGVLTGLAYHAVSPYEGFASTLIALIVIVIGGLGSVTGGVIAALAIGFIEALSAAYLSATLRDVIVYILVGVVLVVRPQGLFGKNAGVLERV